MEKAEAKALLKRVEHGMKFPKTSTESVMTAVHGELVEALAASLAREDELEKKLGASPAPQAKSDRPAPLRASSGIR